MSDALICQDESPENPLTLTGKGFLYIKDEIVIDTEISEKLISLVTGADVKKLYNYSDRRHMTNLWNASN